MVRRALRWVSLASSFAVLAWIFPAVPVSGLLVLALAAFVVDVTTRTPVAS